MLTSSETQCIRWQTAHQLVDWAILLLHRAILFALSIALSYLNYRGLSIVGNAAVISTLYIIVPFVVRALLQASPI